MKTFSRILALVDCTRERCSVPECAVELAAANGASLTIVDVVRDHSWPIRLTSKHERLTELMIEEKKHLLTSLANTIRERGVQVDTKVLRGRAPPLAAAVAAWMRAKPSAKPGA